MNRIRKGDQVVVISGKDKGKKGEIALRMRELGTMPPEERKALAREYFEISKKALTDAMASAPEILFITAAGNSNQDASFVEDIPPFVLKLGQQSPVD